MATGLKSISAVGVDISFGHEGNGDWFTWGYLNGHNGNSPALYKQAFQYVVDKFDGWGVTNVDWVWSVNASWQDDFSASYPGNGYVDRMGMNGFNWGRRWPIDPNNPQWDDWRNSRISSGAGTASAPTRPWPL